MYAFKDGAFWYLKEFSPKLVFSHFSLGALSCLLAQFKCILSPDSPLAQSPDFYNAVKPSDPYLSVTVPEGSICSEMLLPLICRLRVDAQAFLHGTSRLASHTPNRGLRYPPFK